ncbi:MAG TPA: hypothetical protein VKP65_17925 [Rhodothermales bacterium]|nr:hypothetical protein [Rhodothermales bacterium]
MDLRALDTFNDFDDDHESLYTDYPEPCGPLVMCASCQTQQDPDKGICRSCGAVLPEPPSELPF